MELKSLRALVKVAEFGNISQAAIALGMTQSALSRIIASLENDFGGPLFYRTGRGVVLTETGEAALPRAMSIVINSDQLATDLRDMVKAPSGTVVIAMLPSLVTEVAGNLFAQVRHGFPGIRLRILEGFSSQIEEWLADGRADIGLLSRYRDTHATDEEILSRSHLMLVGMAGTSRRGASVGFRELAHLPLVLPANPNGLRVAVDNVASRFHLKLHVVAEADSLQAQKEIIRHEGCYAVLSPWTVSQEVAAGVFEACRIVDPELPRLIVMSSTTQRPLSRSAREVARIVSRLISGPQK